MQPIRGAAKTEFFCDGDELSKLTQLDHALARRPSIAAERAGYRIEPRNTNEFNLDAYAATERRRGTIKTSTIETTSKAVT